MSPPCPTHTPTPGPILSLLWEMAFPHHLPVWDGAWLLAVGRVLETAHRAASGAGCWGHKAQAVCVCVHHSKNIYWILTTPQDGGNAA